MKIFLTILFYGVSQFLCSQNNFNWKLSSEKHHNFGDNISSWDIDLYDNIYIANESSLKKINLNGESLFSQSIKSFGEISSIHVVNPMKICIFSFDYQSNCFIDNTLTIIDECLDLNEINLQIANKISISNKRNRAWIWDSNNSNLIQISMTIPISIISKSSNLSEIINVKNPVFMEEIENHLFLFDDKNSLFVFDLFGSLIHQINDFSEDVLLAKNNTKLWSIENQILYRFEDDFSKVSIAKIPIQNIKNFKLSENYIYIQSNKGIHIYSIDKKK